MQAKRAGLTGLLAVVLSLSAPAGAAPSCHGAGKPASLEPSLAAPQAGHERHGGYGGTSRVRQHLSHQRATEGNFAASCPCCDHCVSMCMLAGFGSAAMPVESQELLFELDRQLILPLRVPRAKPAVHPPYRPPIPPG